MQQPTIPTARLIAIKVQLPSTRVQPQIIRAQLQTIRHRHHRHHRHQHHRHRQAIKEDKDSLSLIASKEPSTPNKTISKGLLPIIYQLTLLSTLSPLNRFPTAYRQAPTTHQPASSACRTTSPSTHPVSSSLPSARYTIPLLASVVSVTTACLSPIKFARTPIAC